MSILSWPMRTLSERVIFSVLLAPGTSELLSPCPRATIACWTAGHRRRAGGYRKARVGGKFLGCDIRVSGPYPYPRTRGLRRRLLALCRS